MKLLKNRIVFLVGAIVFFGGCIKPKAVIEIKFENNFSSESDSVKTINSLHKYGDILCMNFYGSFEKRLSVVNNYLLERIDTAFKPHHNIVSSECSIFSVSNDSSEKFFARNFDSRNCGILLAKYNPPGKYSSFAFSRLEDIKFNRYTNPKNLTKEEKQLFLYFPFYAADGMNEKGLAVGIAGVNSQRLNTHPDKEIIFVTWYIRKILDNCKNVDEVIELSKNYDLYDGSLKTISHHFLVTDAEGNSLVVEYKDGDMKFIKTKDKYQIITNQYIYKKPIESNLRCWRYNKLYRQINKINRKKIDADACIKMLKSIYNETTWSVVYDLKQKKGVFAKYNNYNKLYEFRF